jgi:hypothetical protein
MREEKIRRNLGRGQPSGTRPRTQSKLFRNPAKRPLQNARIAKTFH